MSQLPVLPAGALPADRNARRFWAHTPPGSFFCDGDGHLGATHAVKQHSIVRQRHDVHGSGNGLSLRPTRHSLPIPALVCLTEGLLHGLVEAEAGG
jgi:hypothetical protein